jgi:hypothetical protein
MMHIPRTVLLTRRHAGTVTTSSSGRIRHQHRRVYHVTSATAASCLVVAAAALSMSVAVLCDCNDGIHQNHADGINDDDDGGGGIGIGNQNIRSIGTKNIFQQHPQQYIASASTIFSSSPSSIQQSRGHFANSLQNRRIVVCDYAIIGHGKAGRSAARTIGHLEPTANIVIIDPNHNTNNIQSMHSIGGDSALAEGSRRNRARKQQQQMPTPPQHLQFRANFIDPTHRLIHAHSSASNGSSATHSNEDNDDSMIIVQYRKSALLATGSRGAPPPEGCIHDDARSRILELRSTSSMPSRRPQHPLPNSSLTTTAPTMQQSTMYSLPILDPLTVRSVSSLAVSQGATIAIMGSGFEALELAANCARIASASASASSISQRSQAKNMQQQQQQKPDVMDSNAVSSRVKLLFGNSSPMNNRLPRYLGVAVTKRLRQNGIDVEDRTLTRYIAMKRPVVPSSSRDEDAAPNSNDNNDCGRREVNHHRAPQQLEIYTVKSYDHMDTKRVLADLLVTAPSVDGLHGTAVMPTLSYDSSSDENDNTSQPSSTSSTSAATMDYLPWSSLISPPLLTCYLDDGRVVTNAELNASSSLFAAGSVARYPDWRTGRAEICGGRNVSAEQAGEVAARNMVRGSSSTSVSREAGAPCYLKESIPVWRSDVVQYLPDEVGAAVIGRHYPSSSTLALYSMGIHALCVGRCDSECMATHGFWWTNQSTVNGVGNDDVIAKSMIRPNAFMRRATRRITNSSSNAKSSGRGSLPVYGSGVIFYLDRSGNVVGVMLWGLPYTSNPRDAQTTININLVERMKSIIRSNGGVSVTDHSENIVRNHPGMNLDMNLLSYLHLAEESKYLATMALKGISLIDEVGAKDRYQHSNNRVILGRPLHRYTPIKPVELTNIGKMHRKDEAGHATEEDDIFYSSMASSTSYDAKVHQRMVESGRPPSLKRIYPMQDMLSHSGTDTSLNGTTVRDRRNMQLDRSRPPKEEPLWMRHGDEYRFVSKRDVLVDSFLRNIQSGRFSDGSDAVKQAPMPKIYLDVKEKWNTWNAGSDDDTDDVGEQ